MKKQLQIGWLIILGLLLLFGCSNEKELAADQVDQPTAEQKSASKGKISGNQITYELDDVIVTLPIQWKGKYEVYSGSYIGAEKRTVFRYKDKTSELFSIIQFSMNKEKWDQQYGESLLSYIGTKGGKTYAYSVPTEAESKYYDKQGNVKPEGKEITKMMNDDLPQIIEKIKLK
ncbi:hypothetical protein SAMN05444392_103240 [Seinonella peptonophila]|uniref:Lipoprotein n=1 Tax=Seinonella peptonophila TaxID=112248 RepID=A0A1M4WIQ5_9BACL|nr:hypothetical protein [Seinonella peptonophila]SHE81106.1 hypothetical protein SAMN05444392_103240 [Seinonella peptonophila]